ncbi:GNAT family N-acetyltransferase [Falsiroseomonas sp. HW251]|uniref:GNAT family N-acetyltransferase n=1 Tax=Falsiroseomonas sp. HW251 TaxID=3390998 RepID=UPI003D32232A
MTLSLRPLDASAYPAFEALLAEAWARNWDAGLQRDLAAWRYRARQDDGGTWLAFDGDRCVALLDSFVRPWLLDGRPVTLRETCDWYCAPSHRPAGLGIALMRRMMQQSEPMLSIGGTAATLSLLPRLRWAALPPMRAFVLPVKARGLAGGLLRRRWPAQEGLARAIPGFLPLRPPRAAAPPGDAARIEPWDPAEEAPVPQAPGLVQLLSRPAHEWLCRVPATLARPVALLFRLGGVAVGASFSLLAPAVAGQEATIVRLQIAEASQAIVDWVVAETALALASLGAGLIRCLAGAPATVAALERAGFLAATPRPVFWWSRDLAPPSALDAGFLRADDAVPLDALRGRRLAAIA